MKISGHLPAFSCKPSESRERFKTVPYSIFHHGINRYSLANISYTSIQFCKSRVVFICSRLLTIIQLICAAPSLQVEQSSVPSLYCDRWEPSIFYSGYIWENRQVMHCRKQFLLLIFAPACQDTLFYSSLILSINLFFPTLCRCSTLGQNKIFSAYCWKEPV